MSVIKEINDFSIKQICDSGQCFRMNILDNDDVEVIADGKYLTVNQSGNKVTFNCPSDEYEGFWKHYFDLDGAVDYAGIKKLVAKDDTYLKNAIEYSSGIRILNQELWEMIISFIISQRNNIKRIKNCIKRLCEAFGKKHVFIDLSGGNVAEKIYYDFPTPEALYNADIDDIKACGVGYRDAYIKRAAEDIYTGAFDINSLYEMDYTDAKNELLKLFGVGEKVADCICLFALHKLEAFPKDTHIISIVNNQYDGEFPFEIYGEYAGVLQQYMFYYDLNKQGI